MGLSVSWYTTAKQDSQIKLEENIISIATK
jgi:hypothetical protein